MNMTGANVFRDAGEPRVVPCVAADAAILRNLYPLYLHDLAEFTQELRPNRYGVYDGDDTVTTLAQWGDANLAEWWNRPGILYPYLIHVGERAVGFALVSSPPYLRDGTGFLMNEFFLTRSFRHQGIARSAARQVLDRHRGRWQAVVLERNIPAQRFWRRVLAGYENGVYSETAEETTIFGDFPAVVFAFDNGASH